MAARRTTSTIERLGLQELVGHLFESGATYEQIIAQVKEARRVTLSRAALSRYHRSWSSAQRQLELAQQDAAAIMQVLQAKPDADFTEAAMAMLMSKLVRRFANAQESFESASLDKLGWLLVKAARAQQTTKALELQRERVELLKQKIAAVAEKVSDVMQAKGLDAETLRTIREEIYGLAPP